MKLMSPSFKNGGAIERRFTCDGEDFSPELLWEGAPEKTKSFALIVDDPDAPMGTWVHWLAYNIPGTVRRLEEHVLISRLSGASEGINDEGKLVFHGPCPPSGTHRYFFKLYALDIKLEFKTAPTKSQMEAAMKGHVLATAQLIGTYKREKK
ncbi:MAG TPA: YbhB/YbcL family Raf kinase inhibitor-like protein [Candidatus Babeliales bacterium]|nr:YbhB/YbcL family Raf kinase inhibitor-like protein [Candidatus Babeliales bacterium]